MIDPPLPPHDLAGSPTTPAAPPFIQTVDLHKHYHLGKRNLEVLCGVSFQLERGEFIALRGASGAGKSTLLHLLGGIDTPNKGEIQVDGKRLSSFNHTQLAAFRIHTIGLVFQAYHLLPELDALENVCLPARIARLPLAQAESQGRELLARVGLDKRLHHKPSELSGGEQQRVAIARSLINDPPLLLADEPTGNLDSHTGEEIIELLCDLRVEKQTTLIIATHDSSVAARAPRIVELVDGKIA